MIYNARFELLVSIVPDSIQACLKKVEELGGYLQKRDDALITVRVPARAFQPLVEALPGFGQVVRQALSALDVTKQYLDLQIRIENAEKARQRLLGILEKAEKVEDILKIEQDLRRLSEEIERLKGELKYLADQAAYSTVEVLFRSVAPEPAPVRRRARSRFEWLNEVGVEYALQNF
jgi:chemotaxis protein histidine kinase CheA